IKTVRRMLINCALPCSTGPMAPLSRPGAIGRWRRPSSLRAAPPSSRDRAHEVTPRCLGRRPTGLRQTSQVKTPPKMAYWKGALKVTEPLPSTRPSASHLSQPLHELVVLLCVRLQECESHLNPPRSSER